MSKYPGKREFRMEFSDRRTANELSGHEADARRIQNVLFGQGRAGDYGLGVDAQSFTFEFNDRETRNELADKARSLIMRYCPDVVLHELAIEPLPQGNDPTGKKNAMLAIAVSLGRAGNTPHNFAILVSKSVQGLVVSELVI